MSILKNIDQSLDSNFKNFNYLPQGLSIEDQDQSMTNFIKDLNLTVLDENQMNRKIPVIFLTQELWAEKKMNWPAFRAEYGEEIIRPFITIRRANVEQGTSPLRRTIPLKKKFYWLKVATFNGTQKNYVYYKIPQPTWVDIHYEVTLTTQYMSDVNAYFEKMFRDAFSDGQGYMNINGYFINSHIDSTNSERDEEIDSEKDYRIIFNIIMNGKLIDPTQFEKINGITRISININENIQP